MTATYPARTDRAYRGVVYGIDVLDHNTGQVIRNDYVGQTRQRGRARENQHRDDKPWSDLIVGSSRVLWEGICTDDELVEMERRFIQDVPLEQRPRLNWKLNEDNPRRIPKWVQLELRHERDDDAGRPRWVEPKLRDRSSLLDWDSSAPGQAGPVRQKPSELKSWQRRLIGWGIAWPGSSLIAWLLALHWHLGGWKQTLTGSTLLLPVVLVIVLLILQEKASRKTRRRFTRWLVGWPR